MRSATAYSIRVQGDAVVDQGDVDLGDAVDPLVLAIDVGTSSSRALAYDARARAVSGWESHHPYQVKTTPDGGVEADADQLLELVAQCIDDVVAAVSRTSRQIAAVACDTFWHSLMGVGGHGQALTPVYIWADLRSAQAARELRRILDERAVHARTGVVLHASYLPAKLRWLSEMQPDLMDHVAYWMSLGEWLYLQLLGERRVSISMASGTGLFDQRRCAWDEEMLQVLPLREEQLSPVAEFSDLMTGLRDAFAGRWPTLREVPWYLPLGDGACNNVGSGGFGERWAVAMIGTSGALRVVHESSQVRSPPGLWTYRLDRRRLVQGGAVSDGGNVFAWLARTLRLDDTDALERELQAMPPDAHGLTVLPFLAGERSPHWNLDARAAIVGMTLNTRPLDISRAALEAMAYRFGIVFDLLKQVIRAPVGIIGSGAGLIHSPAWMQIMTDVLGEPLIASAVPEATSRGAALLALEAMGIIDDLAAVPAPLGKRYTPVSDHSRIYRAAMARQERLYDMIEMPEEASWLAVTSTVQSATRRSGE